MAGQTVPTMAGQTVYYAGQTVPTIAGQTVPYHGQIAPPVAGLTAPLTTGQTGPWAGQTGSWEFLQKQSPRTVPSHSNPRQDHFPQKNRSGGSKVKKVKKVWVRKEVKAPEVVAINEESQDVHVPTGDAAKTIQAEKTKADAIAVDIGCLTEPACRSNRQTTAGLTDGLQPV
uniref:Uncharacterized protein n=1 Tax=Oryza sativa subsp. japonica TaxID=39947 RepID=Q8LMW4_ORYSJ|nr:hypothetical protein [Oryza sativa Japonica Group]